MDDIKGLLSKRLKASKPNVRIHSEAHALADEISGAFGERNRFAMYLGVIKRVGVPMARRIYQEIKQESKGHLGKLFMFRCRQAPKDPANGAVAADTPPSAMTRKKMYKSQKN